MTSHGFLIAAPASGTGKTTVALGIMRALIDRGIAVAPFKTGPDYIDTQYHAVASRRPSVNLDTFLSPGPALTGLFGCYVSANGGAVAVVEGAMGLFDGYDRDRGSCADVARTLGLPVVLVVNARSAAYTLAPLLAGLRDFDDRVRVAGVIFNRVGSARHRAMVRAAAADVGMRVLGCIPSDTSLSLPSRHLGLTLSQRDEMEAFVANAARIVADNVDLDAIKELTYNTVVPAVHAVGSGAPLRIAVARDMAFSFIYTATADALARRGDVVYFSPMTDRALPDGCDVVYLPGGYPELHTAQLAANITMLESIRRYAAGGGRILAECGGLIYLCRGLLDAAGVHHDMCGVLPMTATMEGARLHLGYRSLTLGGLRLHGHEFHYSRLVDPDALPSVATVTDAMGNHVDTPLYRHHNVIAGYTHLYTGDMDITQLWDI